MEEEEEEEEEGRREEMNERKQIEVCKEKGPLKPQGPLYNALLCVCVCVCVC